MIKEFVPKGVIDKTKISMTPTEQAKAFEEWISSILKTRQGLQYLIMKYPNLSIITAINEFKIEAAIVEQSC